MKAALGGALGDVVQPASGGQLDGAEDAALLVLPRRHHLLQLALDDPGRAEPGQQVDVGLVLGQDHRAFGQGRDLLVERGQDRGLLGVALGHQPGATPTGLLTHSPGQGRQRHRRVAQRTPQLLDRPGPRLPQQHADAPAEPGAPYRRGAPGRGRSSRPATPSRL